MTLLALLLAIVAERLFGYMATFRRAIFVRYVTIFDDVWRRLGLRHDGLRLFLLLIVPTVAIGWTALWLSELWFGLIWILFAFAVLFLSFGPEDLESDIHAYVDAFALGDPVRQWRAASRFMEPSEVPEEAVERARSLAEAAFVESNRRVFTPMFWFILLGPAGALVCRLIAVVADMGSSLDEMQEQSGDFGARRDLARLASGFGAFLEWVPARLAAIGYALTGSFDHAFDGLRRFFWSRGTSMVENTHQLLRMSGAGAVRLHERLDENEGVDVTVVGALYSAVIDHIHRNVIVWLTVVAFMTLGEWLA